MMTGLRALAGLAMIIVGLAVGGCASNDEQLAEGGASLSPAADSRPTVPEDTELLLLQAAQALEAGRLTRPRGDNAAALYRRVLHNEPGHPEALRGSQNVVRKLILKGLQTARSGDYRTAEIYLTRAQQVNFGHPGIANARAQIRDWFSTSVRDYPIDRQELASRLPSVRILVEEVARSIMETDAHFEIHAGNDEDGIWVYRELVQAAGDHPMRGRILAGREPKLRVIYRRY